MKEFFINRSEIEQMVVAHERSDSQGVFRHF